MKNDRMLAYQMAQKLTDAEIENAISGGGHFSQLGPCGQYGGPIRIDVGWDI